ncbi:hypothetical protein GCM10020221_31340 [Streptomyces thioluteus]|uniref:Uncharacterized protein n=1 Tax=Streptomyces thioluteus TaxID=66431 RepID=A0ABN3X0C7_STRTU
MSSTSAPPGDANSAEHAGLRAPGSGDDESAGSPREPARAQLRAGAAEGGAAAEWARAQLSAASAGRRESVGQLEEHAQGGFGWPGSAEPRGRRAAVVEPAAFRERTSCRACACFVHFADASQPGAGVRVTCARGESIPEPALFDRSSGTPAGHRPPAVRAVPRRRVTRSRRSARRARTN